jgi:SAM-dependent methyltransferase
LLYSANWPVAVDDKYRCNHQSDHHKMIRAYGILDHIVDRTIDGAKFLDFGCGEGHLAFAASERGADISVGLDYIRQGWGIFPERDNLKLTTNRYALDDRSPFDMIVAFDVFDHMYKDMALSELSFLAENLADDGTIYLRMHPWTSRTAAHQFHSLNKAYVQLLFPPDELEKMGIDASIWKVVKPLESYRDWIESVGLSVVRERPILSEIPGILKTPIMVDRMKRLYGVDPEVLAYNYVDYTLRKS